MGDDIRLLEKFLKAGQRLYFKGFYFYLPFYVKCLHEFLKILETVTPRGLLD